MKKTPSPEETVAPCHDGEDEQPFSFGRIVLSERDYADFIKAINGPPKPPTLGLLAAVAEYKARHDKNNKPNL